MTAPRPFGQGFLPGPTDVHPDIVQATLEPMYFTFSSRMQQLIEALQPGLQQLFGTHRTVLISTTAATGLMEAAVRNGVRDRILVVCGGYFGEMFARVAEGCGKEVIRVNVPPGAVLAPGQLERFLDGPPVDAVALVHSESSTGALADLPALAPVIRARADTMLLVDGVTSVGAMPIAADDWDVDFIFTGSQKALALPPGIAFGVASDRMLRRAESLDDRGWYLSLTHLHGAASRNLPLTTPALPVYHALARQLERIAAEGGPEARFARHAAMAGQVAEWVAARPALSLLAAQGERSFAVSAIRLPEGRSAPAVVSALEQKGWLIATGLTPLTESVIRIGHMGDLTPDHLRALLVELDRVLSV